MQQRAIETKAKILAAALHEFSEKGFHGTTVDEICARAGVNKQRIYAYYTNKENLFAEVLKSSFDGIVADEQSFLNLLEDDLFQLDEILLRHYFSYHQSHPDFWRLIAWENLDGGRHLKVLKGHRTKTFQHLRKLYQAGQAQGYFRTEVSFETYMFAISAIPFFYYSNRLTMSQTLEINLLDESVRETLIQECLQILKAHRVSRP